MKHQYVYIDCTYKSVVLACCVSCSRSFLQDCVKDKQYLDQSVELLQIDLLKYLNLCTHHGIMFSYCKSAKFHFLKYIRSTYVTRGPFK